MLRRLIYRTDVATYMKNHGKAILPSVADDGCLGILGGGQLGRMFVIAAQTMGYRTVVFDPDPQSPAGQVAHRHIRAPYEDNAALDKLVRCCVAVTVEFENVPVGAVEYLQDLIVISPASNALAIAQNRIAEKRFMRGIGITTAAFEAVYEGEDAATAFERLSTVASPPYILKSARWGYDGKYQSEVTTVADVAEKVAAFGMGENILEEKVELDREISVIVARGSEGQVKCYPVACNEHRGGILHSSTVPARISSSLSETARDMAISLVETMDYCGVLGVEFFIAADGRLLVNEIAPRPHNSGHYTLDACAVSQFEQQVRAMCRLPIGNTDLRSAAVMINLLGDLWKAGEPPWDVLLRYPDLKLHLYGKKTAQPSRKMGHFCVIGDDAERLRERADALFDEIKGSSCRVRDRPARGGT